MKGESVSAYVSFEDEWRRLAPRVTSFLRNRNCDASTAEDLTQEAALRLYGMWDRVASDADPWPLVVTIVLNLLRDRARESGRLRLVSPMPDSQGTRDTENEALSRLEFSAVVRAMNGLNQRYRDVLVGLVDDGAAPVAAGAALKMLRSRARRRWKSVV